MWLFMKPIAAENKPSLNTGIISEVKKNEVPKHQGKQDLPVDISKKSAAQSRCVFTWTEHYYKV